jgi:hypothetical protein
VTRAFAVALLVTSLPRAAGAHGAYPDVVDLHLPADQPELFVAPTSFGLLISHDAGATFHWLCKEAIGLGASRWRFGPAPGHRWFSVAYTGLYYSDDAGCTWVKATGDYDNTTVTSVRPDPVDPSRVALIGYTPEDAGGARQLGVFMSADGGATFTRLFYPAPAGATLNGVWLSEAGVAYVAVAEFDTSYAPFLARSDDDGESWTRIDLPGNAVPAIAAADASQPESLYVRLISASGEMVVRYDDSTGDVTPLIEMPDAVAALLSTSDALYLSTTSTNGYVAHGAGFTPWATAGLHIGALGERGGVLYAGVDTYLDGYAISASSDGGATWERFLGFGDVAGPLACGDVPQLCAESWSSMQNIFGIASETPAPEPDGCSCAAGLPFPIGLTALLLRRSRARCATRGAAARA